MILPVIMLIGVALPAAAEEDVAGISRFFFSGDGWINLESRKNGTTYKGRYRLANGSYDPEALEALHLVFDAPYRPERPHISLRLIEYLDYLEDEMRPGARITITSGYRSPAYNRNVRQGGGLAAKASLHQYGMAADLVMAGVPSRKLWRRVKTLKFGGAGYYQGESVHIDVGPARSWDQKTSGVGTGISDDNKLIGLVTDYDIYPPESVVTLRFIRMTAFPIGVAADFELRRHSAAGEIQSTRTFRPQFEMLTAGDCHQLADIDQMAFIRWRLSADLKPGRYDIQARFCGRSGKDMPASVRTPPFSIAPPL
ncbi:MAG: DUF882 domain-containing protein [Desulfobacterales bacterium]|nr:DUF882 domain-containing protein [Desulfobacterales bacterium]